jgi:Activator of mitotic machinery Cdc14 phosphatase activation C-term
MYGLDPYEGTTDQRLTARPLSFVPSPLGETIETSTSYFDNARSNSAREPLTRTTSNERRPPGVGSERPPANMTAPSKVETTRPGPLVNGGGGGGSPASPNGIRSPTSLHRSPSETATQEFPLNDIDYESSPAAVAQELSNLQAIRRMSMDVNALDPDLPTFNPNFMPPVAPSHHSDEEDPSRLFWVPARLHPELAPKEFKTFIQDRVKTIKRSSLGEDTLSPEGSGQGGSGSLRRKKSMLSRQVNDANGYEDGAERLERKRSQSGQPRQDLPAVNLHDLEKLVDDPASLARRLSLDTARRSVDSQAEVPANEDMPILPPKPAGQTLKRSTKTNYRRGSLRKGERVPGSRRAALRYGDGDGSTSPVNGVSEVPKLPSIPDVHQFGLTRVQTEPLPQKPVENFSRPGRRARTPPVPQHPSTSEDVPQKPVEPPQIIVQEVHQIQDREPFHSRFASNGRTTANLGQPKQVPAIVETPPNDFTAPPTMHPPERKSSIEQRQSPSPPPQAPLPQRPMPQRPPLIRPGSLQQQQPRRSQSKAATTLDEMAAHPSPLPGVGSRTDSLSIIPTFADDRKPEKKGKEEKEETRKTSWGWFRSSDDKEKKEKEEAGKKNKSKLQKADNKVYDGARLDVLQNSIDGPKGRESLVLDRSTIQIEDEKRPVRKVSSEKKEKDGIFSSLFGGSKKKGDRESTHKKHHSRGLSPEPPPRILRPDIDYNWSRFSILEERAIYRMAHIKLANPRRELYSQVLLSNFMYSYLAKVQQMHPQMQLPQNPAQKKEQEKRQAEMQKHQQQQSQSQQKKDTPEEFAQYQRYQEVGRQR